MTVKDDVNGLLANPRINFHCIDGLIVHNYDANILSKVSDFFHWLEEQKNVGKEIIRNEIGRTHLPKTPKRGYCFSQEAEAFQKCRKMLLDSVTRGQTFFANDRNTPTQTPKSSRYATTLAANQRTMLNGRRIDDQKTLKQPLFPPKECASKQKTPIKVNKYPTVTISENNTPKRTPLKNLMTSKITTQKFVINTEAIVRKTTVTPKVTVDRSNNVTPKMTDKKNAISPKSTVQQRSEVIRKMEKRANTVIKNKEELMKEKAERARRDREERAMRVKMNNKKKEEEALEKLRIIKMREQQIEELRQKQRIPQRAISKSPCRTRGHYNHIQKSVVRAKSSQNISLSAPKKVLQKILAKDGKENPQFQGKRNRVDSVKQNIDIQNKRLKLDLEKCNEGDDVGGCTAMINTPEKLPHNEFVGGQAHIECFESDEKSYSTKFNTPEKMLHDQLVGGQAHTECVDRKNSGERSSRSSICVINESEQISKQETLRSLESNDVSPHIVMHSSVVEDSGTNEKGILDEASHEIEFDIPTGEASSINNQTFDKSTNLSTNEILEDIGNNYDVESISSNDATDDEENPRKPVPLWAQGEQLKNALRKQVVQPPIDPDAYFGPVRTPMLDKIFARNRARYYKRTSSAQWTSPMSNPKKGTSRFFELQNVNRSSKL